MMKVIAEILGVMKATIEVTMAARVTMSIEIDDKACSVFCCSLVIRLLKYTANRHEQKCNYIYDYQYIGWPAYA
jgi:hypothetical protein